MPEIEEIRKEFEPRGIRFIALSLEPDEEVARAAAERLHIRMRVAFAAGEILGPLGVNQVPSTIFVRADGTVAAAASGARKRQFLEERTRELLR